MGRSNEGGNFKKWRANYGRRKFQLEETRSEDSEVEKSLDDDPGYSKNGDCDWSRNCAKVIGGNE